MLNPIKHLSLCLALFGWVGNVAHSAPTSQNFELKTQQTATFFDDVRKKIGINYFSFFYGPGIHPDKNLFNPNQLGKPENDGVYFQNQVSVRYKFTSNLAFDFQSRFKIILNNSTGNADFTVLRWETPRVGVSGDLLSGKNWTLTGAINTDFPYSFPAPFTGYQAQKRTVVFNPGMFASFRYQPVGSRWSIFSVVSPRYFFYSERNTAESQMSYGGYIPQNKPELIIAILPTLNYNFNEKMSLSLGTNIDYRKQIISTWNIFKTSLLSNGDSPAWRLNAIPVNLGLTYSISKSLTFFPFVSAYPIAAQRIDAITGKQASFLQSASVGMWVNGTVF